LGAILNQAILFLIENFFLLEVINVVLSKTLMFFHQAAATVPPVAKCTICL